MKNEPIVPKQTSYARVLSGEIAILLDYDFNAYRAKYKDKANVAFVIPAEGTVVVPYVMSLVAKAPHAGRTPRRRSTSCSPTKARRSGPTPILRPVRAGAMPKDVQAQFLPAAEYARAKSVDYGQHGRGAAGLLRPLPEGSALSVRHASAGCCAACAAPAFAFFAAFWLLPVARLIALPAAKGWETYFVVLTDSRYLQSMLNTLALSLAVTAVDAGARRRGRHLPRAAPLRRPRACCCRC